MPPRPQYPPGTWREQAHDTWGPDVLTTASTHEDLRLPEQAMGDLDSYVR